MMIATTNDIPVGHEWFEGFVNYCEGAVKYTTAEVSKGFVVGIAPGTYQTIRSWIPTDTECSPFGIGKNPTKTSASL